MKVWFPKDIGFCVGVKNAVDKALAAGSGAYCLGEIVHNKFVADSLAEKGVTTVESVADVPSGATMIIRAHGEPPETYREAERRNIKIVDATCPSVRAIQKKAEKYHALGYKIVLIGNKNHPEIIGVNGWCCNSAVIFDGKGKLDIGE